MKALYEMKDLSAETRHGRDVSSLYYCYKGIHWIVCVQLERANEKIDNMRELWDRLSKAEQREKIIMKDLINSKNALKETRREHALVEKELRIAVSFGHLESFECNPS